MASTPSSGKHAAELAEPPRSDAIGGYDVEAANPPTRRRQPAARSRAPGRGVRARGKRR